MHRQTHLAERVPSRARRVARGLERRGIAATYALHDRVLANRASRRRFEAAPAPLDQLQQSILSELDEKGYAVVPFAELIADDELVAAVEGQGDAFIASTEAGLAGTEGADQLRRRAGKEFVVRAHSFEGDRIGSDDPWLRAAVSSRLLGLANAYLRMWSKLSYLDRWYTVPLAEGAERSASQLWHLDFDDRYLLKAFLYLNDVGEDAGPFEYVPRSQAGGRYDSIWHWEPMGNCRVADDELRRHVPDAEIKTFTAPRGTLILCNTSGLHRGGFSTSKPRVLATATYCSPASVRALSVRNFEPVLDGALDAPARFALS